MSDDKRYVVVKEPDIDWCRLRRADSPEVSGLEVLWEGNSLKVGYEAMIRLNNERRPVFVYSVCSKNGAFRLFKGVPSEHGWVTCDGAVDYSKAKRILSDLVAQRNAARRAEREELIGALSEAGVSVGSGRLPKLTPADHAYLGWIRERRKTAGVVLEPSAV